MKDLVAFGQKLMKLIEEHEGRDFTPTQMAGALMGAGINLAVLNGVTAKDIRDAFETLLSVAAVGEEPQVGVG